MWNTTNCCCFISGSGLLKSSQFCVHFFSLDQWMLVSVSRSVVVHHLDPLAAEQKITSHPLWTNLRLDPGWLQHTTERYLDIYSYRPKNPFYR